MIKHLKIKFVCINMLIVTVMLSVIFGMVLHITNRNMRQQGERIIQSIHDNPMHRGPGLHERREPYFVVTVTPQGAFTLTSDPFFDKNSEELLEIARQVYEGQEHSGLLRKYDLRFSRRMTPVGEQIVFLDVSTEWHMLQDLYKTCSLIALISYAVFLVISILLAQWAVHPVEVAWKQQRQFVADASHELKTPLTVIMTNAELLQDGSRESEEKQQFARSILTMSHQMRGLVEGLLNLARVDNGAVKTTFEAVNFSELVEDCLLPFEPVFFENGLVFEPEIDSKISVQGSQPHLRQVVDILLDNASKYAEPGSSVKLRLKKQGIHALLTVSNPAEDLSKEELKGIFKRFYRADKARAMNHSYGLGLSIAESIVKEHSGKIWAESQNGILSFHVQLLQCCSK